VANSFVKTVVSNFVCKSETNEKIPPPPLFTSRLVKKSVSPECHVYRDVWTNSHQFL
jgi:hypothetical protein